MKLFLITSAALASVAFAYADSGNNQLLIQTSLVTLVDPWTHWNSFIASQLPALNDLVKQKLPNSYGYCYNHNPPGPCICHTENGRECADLYFEHVRWAYKVKARWISGINTLRVDQIQLASGGGHFTLQVSGALEDLKLRLQVEQCITFDRCTSIFDNSDGCCGREKRFTVKLRMQCSSGFPYLTSPQFESIEMDKLQITQRIGPVNIKIKDITGLVKGQVSTNVLKVLTEIPLISIEGQKYTVLNAANEFFKSLDYGSEFPC